MALVFKVKFQDTLRRWVAPEAPNADSFAVTFKDLESKIRELFHLTSAASLAITYVDKDNDVVTLADDQDLIDACLVQGLNPLRLDVVVGDSREHIHEPPHGSQHPPISAGNLNIESFLSTLPQATSDTVKRFLRTYAPYIDPKLPPAACLKNIESVFKDFVDGLANHHHGHPKSGERPPCHGPPHHGPPHHGHRHPFPSAFHPRHGETTSHWGIECDGCGMSPIEGSRYKSTKESDYDLCEHCFKAMGNESDYLKLDRSAHHPPPPGYYRPPCLRRGSKPVIPPRANFARGPYGWKPAHPHPFTGGHQSPFAENKKLDARFVKDVTIFDGTEVVPGTKFTKIWRLSNIGTLAWPQGTRLVHIGGDVLGTDEAVVLELPEHGVPCGEEMEVSVDLAAPEKAGRYVSHWRLSAPWGQKFGHRVWVVIHVVPQGERSPQFQASLQVGEKGVEASEETVVVDNFGANTTRSDVAMDGADKVLTVVDGVTGVVEQVLVGESSSESGASENENNTRILYPDPMSFHMENEGEKPKLEEPKNNNRILYPDPMSFHMEYEAEKLKLEEDGFSLVEKPSESTDWFDVSDQGVDETGGLEGRLGEDEVPHETLLQALESMGFTERNLNISMLQSHNFELEGSVDDLLVAAGWDGALKDLEEMGFNDKHTNVRVLVKNKGSLKQTVKDLVKLEKVV